MGIKNVFPLRPDHLVIIWEECPYYAELSGRVVLYRAKEDGRVVGVKLKDASDICMEASEIYSRGMKSRLHYETEKIKEPN